MGTRKQDILLVEPAYRSTYPPLGLMKIATAHKLKGDNVIFCRGTDAEKRSQQWDRIYITTLFTFQWSTTLKTIRYYARSNGATVLVGGVLASLMPHEIEDATSIAPHIGPLNGELPGLAQHAIADQNLSKLSADIDDRGIAALPPDYGIFADLEVPYREALDNCYILRSSEGCTRGCDFCAVNTLEPSFVPRIQLEPAVSYIAKHWGDKRNLLLLDDNLLLSPNFDRIVDEIRDLGFSKGSKLNGRLRHVDLNQGLDLRLLKKKHVDKLAQIALRPFRIAFDHIELAEQYEKKMRWVIDAGFREISTYVLYNHLDTPADLYHRLEVTCRLNEEHACRIYSFPMKYIPCDATNRTHLGAHWTRRQVRGVQCILNATHGIAPTQPTFFRRAFGESVRRFLQIIQMPEHYIINRAKALAEGRIQSWKKSYDTMSRNEKATARRLVAVGKGSILTKHRNRKIAKFLSHYSNENDPMGSDDQ